MPQYPLLRYKASHASYSLLLSQNRSGKFVEPHARQGSVIKLHPALIPNIGFCPAA